MSLGYSIAIDLDVKYNKKNISSILKNAESIGIRFHKYIWEENINNHMPLNLEEALESIILGDENNLHSINLQLEKTFMTLNFLNHSEDLGLIVMNFTYPWLKNFDGIEDIDIAKYTQLFLNLVEGCKITKMIVEKD